MPTDRRESKDHSGKLLNSANGGVKAKSSWTSRFRRKSEEHQQEKKVSQSLVTRRRAKKGVLVVLSIASMLCGFGSLYNI